MERFTRFEDRRDAGLHLAQALRRYAPEHPVVVALPRGGVPVAFEVARALDAPLDLCVVRKLGVPWHPELGVGAVAEGGTLYVSREVLAQVDLPARELEAVITQKRAEVEARVKKFRAAHPRVPIEGRTVILVDDGIATGGTVHAAVRALAAERPKRIVLAVPVAAPDAVAELKPEVDAVVSLMLPAELHAIGLWYEDFTQVTDDEVREHSEVMNLPIGYFGASTGAAAALMAAAQRPHVIGAVVSRGGRPDLAGPALENVHAPTLLIVGGEDLAVLDLNEDAMRHLNCERRLSIVRGATHLFEEPGALEEVAQLAGAWFLEHLGVEDELWAPS